jgi:hypothetical protein
MSGIASALLLRDRRLGRHPEFDMLDIVFLASTALFFLLSLAYVRGCDRL